MICGNKEELKDLYNSGEECVNDVVNNGYLIEFTNHTMYCGDKEKLVSEATARGNQLVVVRELICNDNKTKVYKALGITLNEFFSNLLDEVNTVVSYNNGLGALVGGTQKYTVYVGYSGIVHIVKNYELPDRFRNRQMMITCCSTWLGRKSGKRLEYYYMGNKVDIVGIVMETANEFNGKTNLSSLFSLVKHKINKQVIEEPMELLKQKERAKAKKEQEEKEKAAEKERVNLLRTRADKFSSLDIQAVERNNPFVKYSNLLNKEVITIADLEKSDLIAENSTADKKYVYKGNHIIISNDLVELTTELKKVMKYDDLAVVKSNIQENYWLSDFTKNAHVGIYGTREELVRFLCEHIKYDILKDKHIRFKNDRYAIAVNIQNRIGVYRESVHTPELDRYDEKKYRVPYELKDGFKWMTLKERYGLRKFRINHCISNEIIKGADRMGSRGYSISIDEFGYMLLDKMCGYIGGPATMFTKAMNGMEPVLPFYYGKEPKVKIGKSRIDIEISIVSKYANQKFVKEHWKEISGDLVKRIESRKGFQDLGVPMNFWKIGKAIIRNDDVLDVCFDLKLRDNEDL